MAKSACVIGSNGQDGRFLVKELLNKSYKVFAVGKSDQPKFIENKKDLKYFNIDLRNENELNSFLNKNYFNKIFHFASVHGSHGISYEKIWHDLIKVNTQSIYSILENIRNRSLDTKIIYASSSKVFGKKLPNMISDITIPNPECMYSISKDTSARLLNYYRIEHGIQSSVVHLFNHESQFRPQEFFIPKILDALIKALNNKYFEKVNINNLDFHCNWGSAEEYMQYVIEMSYFDIPRYCLGNKKSTYAKKLVNDLFKNFNLNYKDFINEKSKSNTNVDNIQHLEMNGIINLIGQTPEIGIFDLCLDLLNIANEKIL